jgi:hypothetical protein
LFLVYLIEFATSGATSEFMCHFINYDTSGYPSFLNTHRDFKWIALLNEWMLSCKSNALVVSDELIVTKHIRENLSKYFYHIETEWNKRFSVARMTIIIDGADAYMRINLKKE